MLFVQNVFEMNEEMFFGAEFIVGQHVLCAFLLLMASEMHHCA